MSPRRAELALRFFPRTLRVRLALLYAGVFFASSAVLLAIPNIFTGVKVYARASGGSPGAARAATQHVADVHRFLAISLIALAVMFLVSVASGALLSGRLLRPLREITTTAGHISASNLGQRLALGGRDDELKRLGATLDQLFERLQASFESQRHFVANASHELRSPLASQRTVIEVALADPDADADTLRAACETVLTLGEQQEHLIEALLALAASERGIERREDADLASITRIVVGDREQEAQHRCIDIQLALATATAACDPKLTGSLVANLVDNAIRHNTPGGKIEVATTSTPGQAMVTVINTGPKVAPDEIERLFQPFQQIGRERVIHHEGYGLGLSIVQAIAHAHGAEIAARARSQGGLHIEVSFPANPPSGSNDGVDQRRVSKERRGCRDDQGRSSGVLQ